MEMCLQTTEALHQVVFLQLSILVSRKQVSLHPAWKPVIKIFEKHPKEIYPFTMIQRKCRLQKSRHQLTLVSKNVNQSDRWTMAITQIALILWGPLVLPEVRRSHQHQ